MQSENQTDLSKWQTWHVVFETHMDIMAEILQKMAVKATFIIRINN